MAIRVLLSAFLLLAAGSEPVRAAFPKAAGFVNDFANLLDASQRAALDELLKSVERETTAEIVFVSVTSLDGMTEDEYANKLFKQWGVGKKKEDNGVLVVVAPTERAMRIEVGYGLEGVLPDGLAGEIIRTQFTPQFKNNDYPAGIRVGMRRITEIVRANHVLTAEERQRIEHPPVEQRPAWVLIPFLSIFVAIGAFAVGLGARTKTGFPLLFGSIFAGIPLVMGMAVFFTITLFTLGPLALAMLVVGYREGDKLKWRNSVGSKGSGWTMGGGSSGGSSSGSSSSSGGGSSSSGSSFGGGSSGGGGASGRW